MAVNLIKKSKNENEEEERKQILAQIQENSMARKNADIQTVKNAKVNWVNPNASTWQKMGWVARNTGNSAVKSVLDTIGAPMQSLAVGFNRGANQASRERTTYDKIGNAVTNYLATTPTMLGTAIRAKRFWDRNWDTAYQTAQNIEQAKGIGKVGAYLGGVTSAVLQETNPVMQSLYSGSQFYGQLAGEQGARKATEALLSADEKIHEKNDKKAQELAKEGSLYGGITQKAGEVAQTIGYMTPSIAISAITGGSSTGQAIGLVQMGLGSKGQTTRETLKNTGNIEMSERKGVASGTAESSSELMFSGLKAFKPFKANGFEDTAKKWISDAVEKRISSGLGQKALKTMGDWFVDVAGESVEELTTDIYNTWLDQSTTDPNKEYTLEDAVNTIFSTMLSTTALNAGYSGINNVVNNIYNRNQSKVENKESITDEERKATDDYKISIQAMVNNTDIPQEIKDQLQPMLNSNATINENEYNELKESIKKMVDVNTQRQYDELKNNVSAQYDQIDAQIEQLDEIKPENFQDAESRKYYAQQMGKEFDTSTFEQLLATYPENRNGKRTVKAYKEIAKAYGQQMALNGLSFDEVRANTVGAWQQYEPNKNITRYDNKEHKNQGFEKLNSQVWSQEVYDSYKETMANQLNQQKQNIMNDYQTQFQKIEDNSKAIEMTIDNLKPQVQESQLSPEEVQRQKDLVEQFAKNRGINVRYDAEAFNGSNEEAKIVDLGNGKREMVINPNADPDAILVKLATHEMFHDTIRTKPHDKLTQLVMDKLKQDNRYQEWRNSVSEAYQEQLQGLNEQQQNALLDEEMTAKYLGEYLGDEQFVQDLVNSTERSTVQRIMDWINNRLEQLKNVVTGNKEAEYWRKVRENFEKAYNSKYVGKEGQFYNINETTDNQGRALTKEQQEYFKDSKVRDANGNLMVVYHGTPIKERFTTFDRNKAGSNVQADFDGIYFTDSQSFGERFAHQQIPTGDSVLSTVRLGERGNLYEGYLNIQNPLNLNNLTEEQLQELYDYVKDEWKDIDPKESFISRWRIMNNGVNAQGIKFDLDLKKVQDAGYDGLIANLGEKNEANGKYVNTGENEYIVFNSNQFKNIDNLNPTENPDIRYSKKTKFDEALKEDNQGRTLTDYVIQRTNDVAPQLRDENGHLLLMLHGSPNGNIENLNGGTYFTPSREYAERYKSTSASSISSGKVENNPRVYEAYLDIKKPFDLSDETARNIYINDYIKGGNALGINPYLSDAEYQKIKSIDWTEVEDLKEFLKDNGYDYDGIIADEGGDLDENGNVSYRGKSYIPFSESQIIKANENNTQYQKKTKFDEALQQDNQGRQLSEQQQEYFKDSKVRDKNGNLLTMYHGTNADFNEFKYDNIGTTGLAYGRGFYFTDNESASEYYGNNKKEVYLDIHKPMEIGKTQMSREEFRKLVNAVNEATNGTLEADYGDLEDAVREYDYSGDDIDLTTSIKVTSGLSDTKFYKILQDTLGFDGIKANNQGSEKSGNFWIAFQSNQIKNVDNLNPTENPDIRYSKKTKFDEALKEDKAIKENRQYLEKQFKEMTGDSVNLAGAKLAGIEIRNENRKNGTLGGEMESNPYSKEAMEIYKKAKNSVKSSNYLYHSTPSDRLPSILKNGLTIGNKQNQEGVSSLDKLYLSASEKLAESFTGTNSILFRINPDAKLENLDIDLLGGQGSYTITNGIPPEMLQVKENGKWVSLKRSNLAKQVSEITGNNTKYQKDTSFDQALKEDNKGRKLSEKQQEYFKNSKVRDENGRLLEVYHSTPTYGFTIFDAEKLSRVTRFSQWGKGFYFTDNEMASADYKLSETGWSNNSGTYKTYLNITNPLILNKSVKPTHILDRAKLTQLLLEGNNDYFFDSWIPFEIAQKELNNDETFTKEQLQKMSREEKVEKYLQYNFDKGYTGDQNILSQMLRAYNTNTELIDNFSKLFNVDGIIVNGGKANQYIAFYPNQIKNVDNLNPTDNEDIRYNKKSGSYDQYLKENAPQEGATIGDLNRLQSQQKLPTKQTNQLPTQQNKIANDYIKFRELTEQVKNGDITEAEFDRLSNLDDIQKELKDLGKTDKQVKDIIFELGNLRDSQLNEQDINNLINLMGMNAYDREVARNRIARGEPILPTTNVQPIAETKEANLPISQETTSVPLNNQKQRRAYKSIIESEMMSDEAKAIAKKFIGQDTYTPDSNAKQLSRADDRIQRNGVEKELDTLETNAMEGKTIKADDIAVGDRLIQYYSKVGDSENLQRAIRATAMAGTQAGRSVQAFALLRHQTPEGMAIWIQNSVDKLNSKTKNGQFDFTQEMQEKILNSTEENLQENVDEVMKELGQQVPKDILSKLDAWRYFSMLANPKTHIRNIVGNFAMGLTQRVSNKVAGTIEQVTGRDRTKTSIFERRSKANIEFAKNDLKNVSSQLGIGTSKYSNPQNAIQQNQRTFKSDALEKSLGRMFNLNDNLLEAEDNFGLKNAYVRNLSDYMSANKLNPNTITNEQLQKARAIAIDKALEATFHQASNLASVLNQLENKNIGTRLLLGGLVPFKKTPINVAKAGAEYSPAGLAKSLVYDTVQLRKGNINVNQWIDNTSKGLTGTGIAVLGYALAKAGILKAGGDDDKEDKYKQAMGDQPYAVTINGKSYSLDWLAPSGIPLFVGAELAKIVDDKTEKDGETENEVLKAMGRVADATSSLLNPMSEMSMISGITSTIQSFSQDSGQALMNLVVSPLKSYVGQTVPTALGQIARTMDTYERDTSSTETGLLPKAIDQTKNQIMNKIPGLRQMLPTKKDIWGEEVETQDYFHNAVLPYTEKEIKSNPVDTELNSLYEKTGENIYPNTSLAKTVTYEGSKTRLTNQDYNEFKESYGKNSYRILNNLINSNEYKSLSDEQKVKAIQDVYTYANNLNKYNYAQKKGITFETPSDVEKVNAIKANGGSETDYFKYKGITDGLTKDSEKISAIQNSKLSNKSKRAVYNATVGKDDTFYQSTDIDVNEYLKYKTANIEGTKDENGKTISGTKKQAQLDYINDNISGYENRLLLMGKDYKLSRSQQQDLASYIDTLPNADELFELLSKNFTVKNGTVYYK